MAINPEESAAPAGTPLESCLLYTSLIPDGQLFAGLTGGVQHVLGVGGGLGHGLLAHHMLALSLIHI